MDPIKIIEDWEARITALTTEYRAACDKISAALQDAGSFTPKPIDWVLPLYGHDASGWFAGANGQRYEAATLPQLINGMRQDMEAHIADIKAQVDVVKAVREKLG